MIDIAIHRSAGHLTADLARTGPPAAAPIDVAFSPALPLGASTSLPLERTPGDVHATVRGTLRDRLRLDVPYSGGWSILPPSVPARIGERSRAPRVLSERMAGGQYVASLEGLAGQTYRFRVRAPGQAWRDESVTFPSTGTNADGYTTRTLTLGRP